MKRSGTSIRYTYMLVTVLLVIPIVFLLSGITYMTMWKGIIGGTVSAREQTKVTVLDAIRRAEENIELLSGYYDPLMKEYLNKFRQAYLASDGNPEKIDLEALKEESNQLLDFYIIDADGVIQYATFPTAIGIDFREIPDFYSKLTEIRTGNSLEVSRVTSELRTHELRKWGYVSSPDHRYVLEVGVDAAELKKHVRPLDYVGLEASLLQHNPYIARVIVYDSEYFKLGYEEEELNPDVRNILEQVITSRQNIQIMNKKLNIPQSEYILYDDGYTAMDDTLKIIYLEYKYDLIYDISRQIGITIILISFFYTVISLLIFGRFSSWYFVKPILLLNQRVKEINEGNLQGQVPVESDNEIGQLAESFNRMTSRLSQTLISKKNMDVIFNATGAGLFLTGSDFKIQSANDYALNFLNLKLTDILDQPLEKFLAYPLDLTEIDHRLIEMKIVENLENQLIVSNGGTVPVLVTISSFSNTSGTFTGYIFLIKDISRVKEEMRKLESLNIRLAKEKQEWRERSTHDSLTTIWNRDGILKILRDALKDSAAGGEKTAIILCDIDYFKQVNDEFGHQVGDEVLFNIAAVIQKTIRDKDAVGRYGGEEFLVVVRCSELEEAVCVFDRIRRAVANEPFHEGRIRVTLSGGITMNKGDSVEAMINRADQYLYLAKNKGRNRGEAGMDNLEFLSERKQ